MDNENITDINDIELKKKKGRKPKQDNYFDVREEEAVINYLTATSYEERNRIYNNFLKKPLDKMISSIIRRYKLYRKDMNFDEIHVDTHSFLMTKLEKFKPSKEKKAYSYFGTICKNYLMGQIIKDQKNTNRKISYEDISSDLENNEEFSYLIENDSFDYKIVISRLLVEINQTLENDKLSDNDKKLGIALYELFENYENIFISNENNKFNRNLILLSLREMTNLSTKEIRISIKKFKCIYDKLIVQMI